MPRIDYQTFAISSDGQKGVDHAVAEAPPARPQLMGSIGEVVTALQRSGSEAGRQILRFRPRDFPTLIVNWTQFGSAAVVSIVRSRRVQRLHLLLSGRNELDDQAAIALVRNLLGESFPSDFHGPARNGEDVAYHTFIIRPVKSEADFSDVLGLIAIAPAFCEYCGIC